MPITNKTSEIHIAVATTLRLGTVKKDIGLYMKGTIVLKVTCNW